MTLEVINSEQQYFHTNITATKYTIPVIDGIVYEYERPFIETGTHFKMLARGTQAASTPPVCCLVFVRHGTNHVTREMLK